MDSGRIPDKPTVDGLDRIWATRWEEQGIYRFDRTATRAQVYSIDTPPPTASGSLHVGHVFSYTHTDLIARYRRMSGYKVFYPMGWDDNGLPTERRVQNYFGVRCDPTLAYEGLIEPPYRGDVPKNAQQVSVSRKRFIELCVELTTTDELAFEELFRRLGLSVDWTQTYQTINNESRAASQAMFLRDLARGSAYQMLAPTLWDVTFRTAVAQAELEDREQPAAYHRLAFARTLAPGAVEIETTRPELLAACVALVANPDDERYQPLFGSTVTTPIFGVEVPILAHPLADPEKGSGIAMICTFGDTTDVIWWRELSLPARPVIGWDGRILSVEPEWINSPEGQQAYSTLAGATVFTARERTVALLRESGELIGEPRPIVHLVKFYEKGERPLEIVSTRQWYIRNGGRDVALRQALVDRGAQITWHPSYMQARFESWVGGLNGDWLISRQRFFGVPLPLWYPVDSEGNPVYGEPIIPAEDTLPVDPSSEAPPGFIEAQRGAPRGFIGDPDVMDTWATSSLSPQIAGGWRRDEDLFARVYPFDLRPQAHDIIRTWLFSTVIRAHLEFDSVPWLHAAISGWILDPDRKKMGKSKGNAMTPVGMLEDNGADAVRYWAASGRPGADTAFDAGQMKIGRRLAMKILNAGRFVLGLGITADQLVITDITTALDQAVIARLAEVVTTATAAFEKYDYTRALEATESFFWTFCDDYVELVKDRAYGNASATASAQAALAVCLDVLLRLFAPFLPFVSEEVWSWWRTESVHQQSWPTAAPLLAAAGDPAVLAAATEVLQLIRRVKSSAKVSMRAEITTAFVSAPANLVAAAQAAAADLEAAGRITTLSVVAGERGWDIEATLAEVAPTS